jgi:hypothetical protein
MTPEQKARELYRMSDLEPPRPPMTVWDRLVLFSTFALSAYISYVVITNIYKFVSGLFVG